MLLLMGSMVISGVMLMVSMWLYRVSGAEQLDLSRPGYVREDLMDVDLDDTGFAATGPMNVEVMEDFRRMFGARMDVISGVDAFRADALSDETLGLVDRDDYYESDYYD